MRKKIIGLLLGSAVLALGTITLVTPKKESKITFATYTNGDAATYYNSIDSTQSGNTLLTALRTLNLSKRQSTVGYSSMGTTPSGQFKYTDYDTSTVQYDSNGQPYGTKISSFYTYTSATSWNREHVWPNSHGGGSGGDAGSPYPDADIHMPRPTISSENSSRGNSFFVEGMNHSSNGWDPYTAGYSENSRGEAARITFYCTLVNSKLILAPNNTTPSGTDSVTGQSYGSGHTMGNLETLIKWNINYPVTQREKNRNEGAEYLQGNRNAFVDHPEYACKIWGNVNSTIKSMCDKASWDVGPSVSISRSTASIVVDDTTLISATSSDGSTISWTSSDTTVVTVSSASSSSGTNVTLTGIGPGTATITARATINSTTYSATCSVTVSTSGGSGGDNPVSQGGTILPTDLASGTYPTTATSYTAASGISVTAYNTANFSSKIQFKKSGGYLYSNDSMNLGTLTLSGVSGSLTVYAGTTRNPSSTTISGSNGVYDLTGYNYFKIINSSGSVATCSSITVGIAESTKTLSSISVSTAPTKTTYTAGEYFDPTGLVITRTYSDSTSDTYAYAGHTSEFTFSPTTSTALTTSNVSVTITYGGKSCSQAITVNAAKTLSSISVSTAPTKTTYTAGETFDPAGLVITRNYSDSTSDTYTYSGHTSEFSFSPSTSTALTTGNTSVTITYGGKSCSQAITVNAAAKTLSSISISGQTTSFTVDDTFSFGGTVTAHFSDSSTSNVTTSATFSGYNMSVAGNYTVTVSYTYGGTTKTTTYQITVSSSGGSGGGESGSFSGTYNYGNQGTSSGKTWSLTDCTDQSSYWLCPASGTESIALIPGIFTDKTVTSSVVVTINSGTYGSGGNPSESTFQIYTSSACTSGVSATITGTLPTSKTYTDVVYTVSQANASSFEDDLAIKITKPGKQIRLVSITVAFDYETSGGSSDPTLSSIAVSTAPTKTSYTAGEYFNPTGLVITRNYSNSTSDTYTYANHTSEFTFNPSTSTALTTSDVSVTITYGGKSCSQAISVTSAAPTSITAVANKTFYVGDTITISDITVTTNTSDDVTASSSFSAYTFTYADAASGGALTSKTFTNAVTYSNLSCSLTVQVQRKAHSDSEPQDLSVTYTDLPTTYQTSTTERTAASGVKFIAYNLANYSSKMQFKASGGYLQTTEAMNLSTVTINNRETNALTVYGSTNGTSFSQSITGTNDVYDLSGYLYVKIMKNGSNAAYCASITITVSGAESAANVSNYIMYEDTNNQCTTKLTTALGYLSSCSQAELTTFQTSSSYVIATARERLEAWARNQGKTINYDAGDVSLSAPTPVLIKTMKYDDNKDMMIAIVISMAVITLAGTFIIYKKKKRQ